jgi:hypothetical protein
VSHNPRWSSLQFLFHLCSFHTHMSHQKVHRVWKNDVVSVAFLCYVLFFVAATRFILGESFPFSFSPFPDFALLLLCLILM